MPKSTLHGVLAAAELWRRDPPQMVAGWEDAYPFCAAVCSTDAGLNLCQRCPEGVVGRAGAAGRPAHGDCPAGVRLVAFPLPPDGSEVAVLRVSPPDPRRAGAISPVVRVPAAALRRAARETPGALARDLLGAARVLRAPAERLAWQVAQRVRSADRQRAASAALAQFIVATEEFQSLYRNAVRQRGQLERARRLSDRLARDSVHIREHERARIAHQIHDTAAQSLVSAVRFLDAAAGGSTSDGGAAADASAISVDGRPGDGRPGDGRPGAPEGSARHLDLARGRLRSAIGELRAILEELIPAGLELGLGQAIRYRHHDLLTESGLSGAVDGSLPRLEPWVEQVLFGMVSEAMTNAARHSGGRTIEVACTTVRDRVVIIVQDDGHGLGRARARGDGRSPARADGGHAGLGLAGLVRQARWLGGATSIRPRPGGGTALRISVPWSRYRVQAPAGQAPAGQAPAGQAARPPAEALA